MTPAGLAAEVPVNGRALRAAVPRSSHAAWEPPAGRDPLAVLSTVFATLIPELLPVRIARMSRSPFAFFRGATAVMAADFATTPRTGIETQISGDAHVANFGGYASPERRLVFDLSDFDETVRGPWEWDVKRLATSLMLAAAERGFRRREGEAAARIAVRTYQARIAAYAAQPSIDVWYSSIDLSGAVRSALDARARRTWQHTAREAQRHTALTLLPRITHVAGGRLQFIEDPPLLEHAGASEDRAEYATRVLEAYRGTLRHDARVLLDRFAAVDAARKVVGVGSVGTWCALLLLVDDQGSPLLLQVKEARPSALEPFVGPQRPGSHGERIVGGQRMMQAAGDGLLGWGDVDGRCVYVRQHRDMKAAPDLHTMDAAGLADYGTHCAWALARAHARAGDSRAIAAYIGRSESFADAVAAFALAYGEQTERDHAAFVHRFGEADGG